MEQMINKEEELDAIAIVKSKKYRRYADLLCTVLDEGKTYTHTEIEKIIEATLAHQVKKDIND